MTLVCLAPYTMLMHKNSLKRGFTIIELIVAITIIAILASITLVTYNGAQGRARDSSRRTDIANIVKALELYYEDNGQYPNTGTSGSMINGSWYNSGDSSWTAFTSMMSSYMDKVPTDPTNTTSLSAINAKGYTYAYYGNRSSYCGAAVGQMYILVYRFEASSKEQFTDGSCPSTELGSGYYNDGANFYRVVR